MDKLLENRQVKDIFAIERDANTQEILACKPCRKWKADRMSHHSVFHLPVDGSTYSVWSSGKKLPMENWFSNFKASLRDHIMSDFHQKSLKEELNERTIVHKKKDEIFKTVRHMAYFSLKSNLPFEQFPSLLATTNACGLEIGDINHSRKFITNFLELLNSELEKKTATWFLENDNITLTLDIGTVDGVTLLAVLFIKDGKTKLANAIPVS